MVNNIVSTNTAIIGVAEQYADWLISGGITKPGYFNSKPVVSRSDLPQWRNPENIDSGASGIVLFLIELYKQSANNRYLQLAGEIIDNILAYCRNNDTNNYSLFAGRAGVVYILLEYWRLTHNDDLIKEALSLMRPCNEEFLCSDYASDYLYDGRAGTLLLLFCLYQFTKENFLTGYIDQFIAVITDNMQSSSDGFYWCAKGETVIKPSCSFAFGTAGIKYVFAQLRNYTPCTAFDLIIQETGRYQRSCWVDEYGNWGNFKKEMLNAGALAEYRAACEIDSVHFFKPLNHYGWANGTAGILFSGLDDVNNKNAEALNGFNKLFHRDEQLRGSLFNGTAGIGLFFLVAGNVNGGAKWRERGLLLGEQLLDEIADSPPDSELMHGNLGKMYFLLKNLPGANSSSNVLLPFYNFELIDSPVTVNLSVTVTGIRKKMLAKYYPQTIQLLQEISPLTIDGYLDETVAQEPAKDPLAFAAYIEKGAGKIGKPAREHIMDLCWLEKKRLEFFHAEQRPPVQLYLEKLIYRNQVMGSLNNADQWLLGKQLVLSPKIRIVSTTAGRYEYIFRPAASIEEVQYPVLNELFALLHLFDRTKLVSDALNEIRTYLQLMPEAILDGMLHALSAVATRKDLLEQSDQIILAEIRQWIFQEILVIQ
jgi:hypothetical protein